MGEFNPRNRGRLSPGDAGELAEGNRTKNYPPWARRQASASSMARMR